jgi:membrane protease subunit HflK
VLFRSGKGGAPGGGGGFVGGGDPRALWPIALGIVAILWITLTSFHRIGPQERGVVLFLGSYSRSMTPGIGLTLPAPFETVETVDVEEIRTVDIGSVSGESQNLVLTGDQNIIDLAYSVRWNIRDPELYLFELADPDATVQEVAETAMRAVLATITLNEALGAGRTGIEQQVAQKMQEILENYRSGIRIQGIAIKQADPPNEVNDAFKEVSAAKQDATTYVNQATAYAQQLNARAQGEAAAFDKVYEQYKLSPEVTRRRMYYETMEAILADTDKTIIESNNVMPYLPLPEIRRKPKDSAGAGATGEGGR